MFEDLIKPKPRVVETDAKKAADPHQPQFWYNCNRCGKAIKVGYKCGDCNPPPTTSGTSGKGSLPTISRPKDPNPPKPDPAPQGSTSKPNPPPEKKKAKCTCGPGDGCNICGGGGLPDNGDDCCSDGSAGGC